MSIVSCILNNTINDIGFFFPLVKVYLDISFFQLDSSPVSIFRISNTRLSSFTFRAFTLKSVDDHKYLLYQIKLFTCSIKGCIVHIYHQICLHYAFLKLQLNRFCTFATDKESATLLLAGQGWHHLTRGQCMPCFIFILPFSITNFSRLIKLLIPANEFTMGFLVFGFSVADG